METFGSLDLKAHPCWVSYNDYVIFCFLVRGFSLPSSDMLEVPTFTVWKLRYVLCMPRLGLVWGLARGLGL